MDLLCVGVSHRTAPVEVREKLALPPERQAELMATVCRATSGEVMLLSTCNRVELYVTGADLDGARRAAELALGAAGGPEALAHLYEHRGEAAVVHLFRVTASLDSMVVGEPQITGQVKEALELARSVGVAQGQLTRACSAAFAATKRVRTETAVGRAAVSMASAAVELASKVFGGLAGKSALLVGAGEMGELAARHLRAAGADQIWVTSRTLDRAVALASQVGAEPRPLEELPALLVKADLVVCSTASPRPIFTREGVAAVLRPRRFRPLFMVDLAVPRDIHPEVHALEGVYAYDVDDIQQVIADNSAAREKEAARAEVLIAEEVARFVQERALRQGVPVLAQLRAHAEQIAAAELARTLPALGELSDKQKKRVEAMAMAIVNKLLHQPTAKLRERAGENSLAGAAAELFGLSEEQSSERAEAPAPLPRAAASSRGKS